MAFQKRSNNKQDWRRFCDRHADLLSQLQRIALAFRSSDRFEDLLQTGSTSMKEEQITLQSLSETEWSAFVSFVDHFRQGWETYFVETLYPEYFREAARRG